MVHTVIGRFDLCGFIVLMPVALKPAASRPGVPPLMRAPSGSGVGTTLSFDGISWLFILDAVQSDEISWQFIVDAFCLLLLFGDRCETGTSSSSRKQKFPLPQQCVTRADPGGTA